MGEKSFPWIKKDFYLCKRGFGCPVPLLTNLARCSLPAMSIKIGGNLGRGAIRVLAMWKMPHIREGREVQLDECLAKAIGPLAREQRIVFRPAHAGCYRDRR